MKKENREHEIKLIEDINNLQRDIPTSNTIEEDVKKLQDKKFELQELQEKKVNGFIVQARAEYVEGGEKNSKHFANLEKKRASAKTINRLNKNGKDITNNKLILKELEQYYKTLYNFQELDADNITKFNKYINVKLSDEKKNIEGPHLIMNVQ